jgi:hypothetical protein
MEHISSSDSADATFPAAFGGFGARAKLPSISIAVIRSVFSAREFFSAANREIPGEEY